VTLNSGASVHFDHDSGCAPPALAVKPPRQLPAPPRKVGCYVGTPNGWQQVSCSAPDNSALGFGTPEPFQDTVLHSTGSGSTPMPLQFGQIDTTFVAMSKVEDSVLPTTERENSVSFQVNTNTFNKPSSGSKGHWVQFVVQAYAYPGSPRAKFCVWQFDLDVWHKGLPAGLTESCFGSPRVPDSDWDIYSNGTFRQFDYTSIAGATFVDAFGQGLDQTWSCWSRQPQHSC